MLPFLQKLTSLVRDPAPDWVFEISEAGIAYARPAAASVPGFQPLQGGTLAVSPLTDNVLKPDALGDQVRAITGAASGRKGGKAVLILPDYSARIAVPSFDQFPGDPKEQLALVRFRMKKTVPFDIDTAAISYFPQNTGKGRSDVLVVAAALEIVSRYEAPFRSAGLHPGMVITSAIAMAELIPPAGISVAARLCDQHLTVVVTNGTTIRLVRTVELTEISADEIQAVLFPTLAYVEDEMGSQANRILFCGIGESGRLPDWVSDLQIPCEPLRSRFGLPNHHNAGLSGYLESTTSGARAA